MTPEEQQVVRAFRRQAQDVRRALAALHDQPPGRRMVNGYIEVEPPFVVRREGVPVGMQALEGPDYTRDRTVDSWSWLRASARGLGLGKQMRTAVLELAFRHLGAAAAVRSAVVENTSSLGVSRSLGYRDTHTSVLDHSGETLQHLRLIHPIATLSARRPTKQAAPLIKPERFDSHAASLCHLADLQRCGRW